MNFTKPEVHILAENSAWKEVLKRTEAMMSVANAKIEEASLFNQGYYVATRKVVEFLRGAPEQLLAELDGNSGVTRMK